jgi:tRNA-2-methylthio-N6-dimethylallyladenosine synthase
VRVDAALANSLAGTVVTGEYITASPFQPAVTLEASA